MSYQRSWTIIDQGLVIPSESIAIIETRVPDDGRYEVSGWLAYQMVAHIFADLLDLDAIQQRIAAGYLDALLTLPQMGSPGSGLNGPYPSEWVPLPHGTRYLTVYMNNPQGFYDAGNIVLREQRPR